MRVLRVWLPRLYFMQTNGSARPPSPWPSGARAVCFALRRCCAAAARCSAARNHMRQRPHSWKRGSLCTPWPTPRPLPAQLGPARPTKGPLLAQPSAKAWAATRSISARPTLHPDRCKAPSQSTGRKRPRPWSCALGRQSGSGPTTRSRRCAKSSLQGAGTTWEW